MPEQPIDHRSFATRPSQPLIGVLVEEDGQELVRYFTEEAAADAATTDDVTRAALAAIGSCSDLDWDAWADELDRIRHDSQPTPPIDL